MDRRRSDTTDRMFNDLCRDNRLRRQGHAGDEALRRRKILRWRMIGRSGRAILVALVMRMVIAPGDMFLRVIPRAMPIRGRMKPGRYRQRHHNERQNKGRQNAHMRKMG